MPHKIDFSIASSDAVAVSLGERLEQIRLSRNISQQDLAAEAGVSRSTIARLGVPGKGISLDSFICILQALKLTDRLEELLPDPSSPPPESARSGVGERRRASRRGPRKNPWSWADQRDSS